MESVRRFAGSIFGLRISETWPVHFPFRGTVPLGTENIKGNKTMASFGLEAFGTEKEKFANELRHHWPKFKSERERVRKRES